MRITPGAVVEPRRPDATVKASQRRPQGDHQAGQQQHVLGLPRPDALRHTGLLGHDEVMDELRNRFGEVIVCPVLEMRNGIQQFPLLTL